MKLLKPLFLLICLSFSAMVSAQGPIKIALMKYNGGGDWYSVVNALENLIKFSNRELNTNFNTDYGTVEAGSAELFNYPFVFMTGHGNVVFSDQEAENLRNYLLAGGFLYVDDDYGMDPYIRPALKKIFPDLQLTELPFEHPIFHQKFNFTKGVPKIHEHDSKAPQAFGMFFQNRLVVLYTYDSNISDGWEDAQVHKDPEEVRLQALKMGANILQYVFGGQP
jgi:hypothetical protein